MSVEYATVTNPQDLSAGGTKLILKTSPNDPSPTLLGYVSQASSLPRWMTSQFSSALSDQQAASAACDTDLNLYSHDWLEYITFIPASAIDPSNAALPQLQSWQASVNQASLSLQHPLSTGCATATPKTRIRQVTFDPGDPSKVTGTIPYQTANNPYYYAIVTKFDKNPPDPSSKMTEVTIATVANRPEFIADPVHQEALANSYRLRHKQASTTDISKQRAAAFNSIKAFAGSP